MEAIVLKNVEPESTAEEEYREDHSTIVLSTLKITEQ